MRDALLLVDVVNHFRHADGERLLASFRARHGMLVHALREARAAGVPVVYANDVFDVWDGDGPGLVRRAVAHGLGGGLVARIAPQPGERFVAKPRYSAFDSTPLELILRSLETERILLAGAATEGCVAQTAIAAKEEGLKVTVVPAACATVDPELERIALAYLERIVGVLLADAVDAAFD
jgi:nicotinamidase-related amidase